MPRGIDIRVARRVCATCPDVASALLLETGLEETQVLGFEHHSQAFGLVALIVYSLDTLGYHIHVCLRINSPWNRKPRQLQGGITMIAGLRISSCTCDTSLH